MNCNRIVLESIVNKCKKHQLRLNYAYDRILPFLPFTVENVGNFSDGLVDHLDQYIFRFSKLQDVIGNKFFKGMLLYFGGTTYKKPFLDFPF